MAGNGQHIAVVGDLRMKKDCTIAAIVLAAGLSERMGRFKPLLPLGGRPVVERVVRLFQDAGLAEVLVVVGQRAGEVRQAVAPLQVHCVENPGFREGMFSSVQAGIRALPPCCGAFLIHPVDIPQVRVRTVERLIGTFKNATAAVVYPTFDGRRGHPPVIDADLAPRILRWSGVGGLRGFLQGCEEDSGELAVADEAVVMDLDTPEDYHGMLARQRHEGLPSAEECRVLMDRFQNLPAATAAHGRAVAAVARRLARAVHAGGLDIDVELTTAAALLHDVARREANHAEAGARLLEWHGFTRLGPIVSAHMDLAVDADAPLDETQIVYLADKLVIGDQCATLEQRFDRKMQIYGSDHQAAQAIARKRESARRIQAKIERITGLALQALVGRSACPGDETP
jgi:CTP:molybdopterin cytidylyltransferase MocA